MKKVKLDFSGTKEKIILFEKDLAQQRQDERGETNIGHSGLESPETSGDKTSMGTFKQLWTGPMREHIYSQLSDPFVVSEAEQKEVRRQRQVEAGRKWEASRVYRISL